jgi:hypothetical protein
MLLPAGQQGHYPTQMGLSKGKVLVHWCHGAPGAVFLWCMAFQVIVVCVWGGGGEGAGSCTAASTLAEICEKLVVPA